ncbi:MAG: signal peptidase II [Proteobacteria bacterium]|nr:signal peptidase II [Pseudomonadota bacterium]
MSRLGRLAFVIAVFVVVADQAVKYWILEILRLQEGQSIGLLGPLRLTGVWNRGVSFGFLQADHDVVRWALAAFSIIVAAILAFWVRAAERPLFATAVGLVMGGAIGNVIDRVRFGAVEDFIDATALHFPWIFNVADSGISIGICLLLLDMLRQDGKARADEKAKSAAG